MRPLVLDASIVCAWFLEDEVGVAGVRERLRRESGIVPPIFHLEVRNALLVAHRRGRIDSQDLRDHIGSVAALPLLTDSGLDLEGALELGAAAPSEPLRRRLSGTGETPRSNARHGSTECCSAPPQKSRSRWLKSRQISRERTHGLGNVWLSMGRVRREPRRARKWQTRNAERAGGDCRTGTPDLRSAQPAEGGRQGRTSQFGGGPTLGGDSGSRRNPYS